MKQVNLSLETAKQMYFSENQALKAFALENYSKEELEDKGFPKTWKQLKKIEGYYTNSFSQICRIDYATFSDKNIKTFKTEKQAKAAIAMAQLSQLMHVYNDGWIPDWSENNNAIKHTIQFYKNSLYFSSYINTQKFLAFKTPEIRNEFAKNFESLILEAKSLL